MEINSVNKMVAKVIYLHIGESKTATTYIQQIFSKNDDLLKREFSILYPKTGRRDHKHIDFIKYLITDKERDNSISDKFNILKKEINSKNTKNVLLSSESFMRCKFEDINFLTQSIDRSFSIVPILYLRNGLHSVWSKYQENVKRNGLFEPFSEVVDCRIRNIVQKQKQIIELWYNFFGESMKVVIFDNLKQENLDPFEFMMNSCLNCSLSQKELSMLRLKLTNSNSSLSPEKVELIRQLNETYGEKVWQNINLDQEYKHMLHKGKKFTKKYHLSDLLRREDVDELLEFNNSICDYIIKNFYNIVANPYSQDKLFVNQDYLPTLKILPNGFYKRYLNLEENRIKIISWKEFLKKTL